jgi:hypothetical protein
MDTTWTDDDLRDAVAVSTSLTEVVARVGLRKAGGNYDTVRSHIERLSLTTEHFTRTLSRRPRASSGTGVDALRANSDLRRSAIVRLLTLIGRKYACVECGNEGVHNGKPLVLQVDHANGVHDDNRPENVRYLCPNCHSQTQTFCGKRRHGARRPKPSTAVECAGCKNAIRIERAWYERRRRAGQVKFYCGIACSSRGQATVTIAQITEAYRKHRTNVGAAAELGISEAAVRRRLRESRIAESSNGKDTPL